MVFAKFVFETVLGTSKTFRKHYVNGNPTSDKDCKLKYLLFMYSKFISFLVFIAKLISTKCNKIISFHLVLQSYYSKTSIFIAKAVYFVGIYLASSILPTDV